VAEEKRARLASLIRRVEADPFFLAFTLRAYAESEGLADRELAEQLGCPVEALDAVRLCRRPRPDAGFRQDVTRIAERFGLRVGELARIVRQADALTALRAEATGGSGVLRAARDRDVAPDGESEER